MYRLPDTRPRCDCPILDVLIRNETLLDDHADHSVAISEYHNRPARPVARRIGRLIAAAITSREPTTVTLSAARVTAV
jgi:hypothetical protein